MSEIFASGCPILIQSLITLLIMWEIFNFSGRSIFYDFDKVKIDLKKSSFSSFYELKKHELKGANGEELTLRNVIDAYRWLIPIKYLSCIIFVLSILVFLFFICVRMDIFKDSINVSYLVDKSWYVLFILDVFLLAFRGLSRICYILHALHNRYQKKTTSSIIIYTYMK